MNAPRPRDFLEAELLRLRDLKRTAHRRHDDPVTVRHVRAAIDRRLGLIEDELADAIRGQRTIDPTDA